MLSAATRSAFDLKRRTDLPRLGWVVELGQRAVVHCGRDVETFDNGIVEGCWDGPFERFDILGRSNLHGSGAILRNGTWWFCPPCHTLDALYALVTAERIWVANSLLLLFAESGHRPSQDINYTRAIATLTAGIDKAEAILEHSESHTLYRLLADDFRFEDGIPHRRRKHEPAAFPDFSAYYRHLVATISACAANAADPARRRPYALASTCSSGYDSSTASAIMAALGGGTVLTLASARGGASDSGRAIADALGLRCLEHEREEIASDGSEIEFLTPGTGGADSPLAVFEPDLGGTLLLTGYHGDKVWERSVPPSPCLKRGDPSGASLTDFRLRVGFLHLPVPFIGALRHDEIHAISNSPEMRRYSVGGGYDRPICRRILEEAGVPRELVGQTKQAVAMIFSWSPRYLSPKVRTAFADHLRRHHLVLSTHGRLAAYQAAAMGFRVLRKALKVVPSLERPLGTLRDRLDHRFRAYENSRYANLLFTWAIERRLAERQLFRPERKLEAA